MSFTVAFIKKQPTPPSPTPDPNPLPQYIIVGRAGHEDGLQSPRFTKTNNPDNLTNSGYPPEITPQNAFIGVNDAGDAPVYVFKYGNYWCYAPQYDTYNPLWVCETLYGTYKQITNVNEFIASGGDGSVEPIYTGTGILVEPYTE